MLLMFIFCINHIGPPVDGSQEPAHLVRRGLPVIVETYDPVALRRVQSRHQRRMLAKISRKADAMPAVRLFSAEFLYFLPAGVRCAVVHADNLPRVSRHGFHCPVNFRHDRSQRLLGVITGYDKAYQHVFMSSRLSTITTISAAVPSVHTTCGRIPSRR